MLGKSAHNGRSTVLDKSGFGWLSPTWHPLHDPSRPRTLDLVLTDGLDGSQAARIGEPLAGPADIGIAMTGIGVSAPRIGIAGDADGTGIPVTAPPALPAPVASAAPGLAVQGNVPIITEDHYFTATLSTRKFGDELAFSFDGGLLAVGSPRHTFPGAPVVDHGAVYLYHSAAVPTPYAILQPSQIPFDHFAQSLAIDYSGSLMLVGAPGDDRGRTSASDTTYDPETGSVYIYDLSGATPVLVGEIMAGDHVLALDQFGFNLDLSGDGSRALISSNIRGDGLPPPGGAFPISGDMLVYDFNGTTPGFRYSLTPTTPAPYPYSHKTGFGLHSAISADGDIAVVGAHQETVYDWPTISGTPGLGAVYIFDLSGPAPVQTGRITQRDAGSRADFGSAIEVSGDGGVLAVGADQVDPFGVADASSGGIVYVYDLVAGVPTLRFSFTADDNDPVDQFGHELSMTADGNTLLVGAPGWDGPNLDTATGRDLNDGLIYAYDISGGTAVEIGRFGESTDPRIPAFGFNLAVAGDGSMLAGSEDKNVLFGQSVGLFSTEFLSWTRLVGTGAADILTGGAGSQAVFGDAGRDRLLGKGGRDWLDGGKGRDYLNGGGSDDVLRDGAGRDRMKGGGGADLFRLDEDGARDVITDFAPGTDLIDLRAWDTGGFANLTITSIASGLKIAVSAETLILKHVSSVTDADFMF